MAQPHAAPRREAALEVLPQVEARRYPIREALVAAGAVEKGLVTQNQIDNGNYDKAIARNSKGMYPKGRAYLEAQRWSSLGNGRDWIPPQGGTP